MKISVEPMSIVEIYNRVADAAGLDKQDLKYDCTKLLVAQNIENAVREYYTGRYPDDERTATATFNMHWLMYGPKTNTSLEDGEVVVQSGFFK